MSSKNQRNLKKRASEFTSDDWLALRGALVGFLKSKISQMSTSAASKDVEDLVHEVLILVLTKPDVINVEAFAMDCGKKKIKEYYRLTTSSMKNSNIDSFADVLHSQSASEDTFPYEKAEKLLDILKKRSQANYDLLLDRFYYEIPTKQLTTKYKGTINSLDMRVFRTKKFASSLLEGYVG